MSYRSRIYLTIIIFVAVAAAFFLLVFPAFNNRNSALADTVQLKNQALAEATAEQQSYELGQKDLLNLKTRAFGPADLFSQDTKLVKEIFALETAARDLGVEFTLQVSGNAKDAPKLQKTTAQLFAVPYTVTLEGPFPSVINFIQRMEHMAFVTQTKTINVSALPGDEVRAGLTAEFYIRP